MQLLAFYYVNYKGERGLRVVNGGTAVVLNMQSEYHPGKQFILKAFDVVKQEWREFAVKDIEGELIVHPDRLEIRVLN